MPVLTEGTLRHLYAWHRDLLFLAILNRRPTVEVETASFAGQEAHECQNDVFLALVRTTGNPEHVLAFASLAERLGPVQRLADLMLDAIEQETDEIVAALRLADTRRLRRALVRYRRRRMQITPELIERLYSERMQNPPR